MWVGSFLCSHLRSSFFLPASYTRSVDPTPASSFPFRLVRAPGIPPVGVRWISSSCFPLSLKRYSLMYPSAAAPLDLARL